MPRPNPVLRPEQWHWECHWPGCIESTRGGGPFCYAHYRRLTPEAQADATAAKDAYQADLAECIEVAIEAARTEHAPLYAALARRIANPVREARRSLRAVTDEGG